MRMVSRSSGGLKFAASSNHRTIANTCISSELAEPNQILSLRATGPFADSCNEVLLVEQRECVQNQGEITQGKLEFCFSKVAVDE